MTKSERIGEGVVKDGELTFGHSYFIDGCVERWVDAWKRYKKKHYVVGRASRRRRHMGRDNPPDGPVYLVRRECESCQVGFESPCGNCDGTGYVYEIEPKEVK